MVAAVALSTLAVNREPPHPVWPPRPDEPRIEFVRSMRGPADIGQKPSLISRVGGWIVGTTRENVDLQKPCGVAVDESGTVCVTDTATRRVSLFDIKRKRWQWFDKFEKTSFACPVAVARRKGVLYVADSQLGKVFALANNGKPLWQIASPLRRPVGLAVTDELLAVVDSQAHQVFVFDLAGRPQFEFGRRGLAAGEFNFPTHITADRQGHLLVTDSLNCRIQVFDLRGNFVSQFGSNGDTSGHFGRPKGVAVDTLGHVYVADALFDNFQIFELAGQFLLNVGRTGRGPGEFGLPGGIAIDGDNHIYIADAYNHRLQEFRYVGRP